MSPNKSTERVEIRACAFDYKSIQHTSCLDQRVYVTMSSVSKSNQGCTQGSICYKGPRSGAAAVSIHMCAADKFNSGFHPKINGYKGLADHQLLRAHTCVLQNKATQSRTEGHGLRFIGRPILPGACTRAWQNRRSQGCTLESKVAKVWPTSCCCERTHTCMSDMASQSCTQGSRVTRNYARVISYKGL